MTVLNHAWLSDCVMERIIVHWSASSYDVDPNSSHYHLMIDQNGNAHRGDNPISGNARNNPVGIKTSHCKDLNTGSIGIAVIAMGNAIENPFDPGPWPITVKQWDSLIVALAELSRFYNLAPDEQHMLMHGEVQEVLGVAQSGKWDVGRLPFMLELKNSHEVGEAMRELVAAWLAGDYAPEPPPAVTTATVEFTFRDGVVMSVKLVQ